MGLCCIFDCANAREAIQSLDFEIVERYGDEYIDANGNHVHYLHVWDDGNRTLIRCKKCGALFLRQSSEFHGTSDSCYVDWFPVENREQALFYNERYDGFTLENAFEGLRVWRNDDKYLWNK